MLVIHLVPAGDVGPATRANTINTNREVVHRYTYRGLKEDEKSNLSHISFREEFDNSIREIFRPDISPDDFPDVNLEGIPLHDMCEDDTTDAEGDFAYKSEYDEIPLMATRLYRQLSMPEVNDNYVNSSVMFTRGNTHARGKVIGRKIYSIGNSVGRRNDNPILDMHKYFVEFDYGEVRELTINVIVESMYSACDDPGYDYLIMDSIVDYQKNKKAITVPDQKVVHRGQRFMRRSTVGCQLCVQ